ncbi:MAG: hypothetical protein JNJ59_00785 [Deltaproteobacteria bacterium]|nr:hypothetical protein [Deltaproteobacteria bacterium]
MRKSVAISWARIGALLTIVGCKAETPPISVTIEGVTVEKVKWLAADNQPSQTLRLSLRTPPLPEGVDLTSTKVYVAPAGTKLPATEADPAARAQADMAFGKVATAYDFNAVIGRDGTATAEVDIARVPPGPQVILVQVDMGREHPEARGELAWERPAELWRKDSALPAFRLAGVDAELQIKEPEPFDEVDPFALFAMVYGEQDSELKVTARGKVLEDVAKKTARIPVGDLLPTVKLSTFVARYPDLPLGVTLVLERNGQKAETVMNDFGWHLLHAFATVLEKQVRAGKGFTFPGETSVNDKRSLLAYAYDRTYVVGADEALAELDYYAYVTIAEGATRDCGTYGNADRSATLVVRADTITMHVTDRRTGAEVAKKSFPGVLPECPKSFMGKEEASSYAMDGEMADGGRIEAWARTLVQK